MRTDPMMIPTLLYLLKATAILLLTLGVAFLLRRAAAGTRHVVWLTAVVTIVALPLIAAALPDLRVLPTIPVPAAAAVGETRFDAADPVLDTESPVATSALRRSAAVAPPAAESSVANADGSLSAAPGWGKRLSGWAAAVQPVPALLVLWLTGTLLVLARLAHSAYVLRRILTTAEPLESGDWTTPLYEASDRLNLREAPRLLQSDRVAMPFACGLLRPTIVVPGVAQQWTAERRRAVLFHELAHIRRRDLVGHGLGRLACALYWMHPLVWAAAYRLRAESERACDDLVLSTGTPASEYADHLLQILVGVRRNDAPAVALPMGRRREFEGRLLAILDPALRRHRPTLGHALVLAAFSLSAAALVALAPADARGAPGEIRTASDYGVEEVTNAAALVQRAQGRAVIQPDQGPLTLPEFPLPDQEVHVAPAPEPAPAPMPLSHEHVEVAPHTFTEVVERLATDFGEGMGGLMGSLAASSVQMVLGNSVDQPKDVPLLVRVLASDPSAEVRRTAAWALYGTGDDRAAAALVRAATQDEAAEVREMAAWALHELSGPAVVAALSAAARDDHAEVRATSVWSLAHAATLNESIVAALVTTLEDPDPEVRMRGAWAIGTLRPARAPAILYQQTLRDESTETQVAAAWALTQIADVAARPALARALQEETEMEVLDGVAHALLRLGPVEPEALEPLLSSEHAELRAQAVRMLAGAGTDIHPWPWPWPEPRPLP